MDLINLFKRRDAVAGVIEALLLVALVSIIISTIQLVYIPETMENREAEHMDDVENQFSFIKSVIDLQATIEQDVPISSPLTLGSRELPYFVTARAYGQLDVIDTDRTDSRIVTDSLSDIALTSIKYEAFNSYFVDQIYVLEGGSLIIKQLDGESIKVEPAITIDNLSTEIRINYLLPLLYDIPGKNTTGGYKNCFIRTNYTTKETYSVSTTYIRIYTEYLDAWNDMLNKMFEEEIFNGYIIIEKYPYSSPEYVRILPDGKNLYLNLNICHIGAQIGPGVIVT